MFENLSHLALQQYWWVIVSLLGALLVFLLFVQGGQTMIYALGKSEIKRTMLVNALGRKWEFTFTTLVTFGGAFFASFPLFYSTSFGGAYWVWMLILFCFVIQAVAYEFRSKPNNFLGAKGFEAFLFINGLLGTLLLGTAVATFFTGSNFSVNEMNFSQWDNSWHGLELAFDFTRYATFINLSLGIAVFFLSRVLAGLYFMNTIDDDGIFEGARKCVLGNSVMFLVFFLFFLVNILVRDGFAVDANGIISMEPYKYFHNLIGMPLNAIIFLAGVLLVLFGIFKGVFQKSSKGIWFSGLGTVLTVFSLLLLAGFNGTSFYPSISGEGIKQYQSSLTIMNSSSSHYTLTAMSYVSLMVPFVLAYIWYAWKAINNKKIDADEMENDSHVY